MNYLDRVHNYCDTLQANFDIFIVPTGGTFNNWISIGNSGCIQVGLAIMNSVFNVTHGATSDVAKHVNNLRNTSAGYITREMAADGVILEGSLYTAYGLDSYIWASVQVVPARARQRQLRSQWNRAFEYAELPAALSADQP